MGKVSIIKAARFMTENAPLFVVFSSISVHCREKPFFPPPGGEDFPVFPGFCLNPGLAAVIVKIHDFPEFFRIGEAVVKLSSVLIRQGPLGLVGGQDA